MVPGHAVIAPVEWLDVHDAGGARVGRTVDRRLAYGVERGGALAGGEFYLGIHAYIRDARGRYLIQRRALDKAFNPGGWDIQLGYVLSGEDSQAAMCREVREEVGLPVAPCHIEAHRQLTWAGRHRISDVYFLRYDFALSGLTLQAEEVIDAWLIDAAEMVAMIRAMDYRPPEYREAVLAMIDRLAP